MSGIHCASALIVQRIEVTSFIVPTAFVQAMAALIGPGGKGAIERLLWGTGSVAFHPQPLLETFVRDFAFPVELVEGAGIPQLGWEDKRAILFDNYARMTGLNFDDRLPAVRNDSLAQRRAEGRAAPFSTLRELPHA